MVDSQGGGRFSGHDERCLFERFFEERNRNIVAMSGLEPLTSAL